MLMTIEHLELGRTQAGGYTMAQLAVFGIEWPPTKNWQQEVVGKEWTQLDYDNFLAHKRTKKPRSTRGTVEISEAGMQQKTLTAMQGIENRLASILNAIHVLDRHVQESKERNT